MLTIRERGDTLIEVLLAVTIFSLVAVGTMTIMNQGTNAAQRALEITLVRQEVDGQAEALRAAQQAFTATANPTNTTWQQITAGGDSGKFDDETTCPSTASDVSGGFVMDARNATEVGGQWLKSINAPDAPPHAQLLYDNGLVQSYGMWIERTKDAGADVNTPNAYNFTIHACWYGAGMGDTPLQLKTLVRLYDPS